MDGVQLHRRPDSDAPLRRPMPSVLSRGYYPRHPYVLVPTYTAAPVTTTTTISPTRRALTGDRSTDEQPLSTDLSMTTCALGGWVAVDRHLAGTHLVGTRRRAAASRPGQLFFLSLLASHCIDQREYSAPTLTSHTLGGARRILILTAPRRSDFEAELHATLVTLHHLQTPWSPADELRWS